MKKDMTDCQFIDDIIFILHEIAKNIFKIVALGVMNWKLSLMQKIIKNPFLYIPFSEVWSSFKTKSEN
jgi:hypothetical protein